MMARVALATGRSLFDLADAPLHEVVYEFTRIAEVERLQGLQRESEALTAAIRMSYAMNDGKKLERELRDFQRKMQTRPHHLRAATILTDDVMARVNAILAAEGRAAMQPAEPSLPS
jgi:hypothetical protein